MAVVRAAGRRIGKGSALLVFVFVSWRELRAAGGQGMVKVCLAKVGWEALCKVP